MYIVKIAKKDVVKIRTYVGEQGLNDKGMSASESCNTSRVAVFSVLTFFISIIYSFSGCLS